MSHLVALSAPQSGAHSVKKYAGFGILGADIPTGGDNGGSPALNDGVSAGSEYYWRITSAPSAGTLTIFPDLSLEYDPGAAPNGDYPATYELFEDRVSEGTAPLNFHVGPYFVTAASSQQVNQAGTGAVKQTHLIGIASSQQVNAGIAGSISQSSITFVAGSNSIQINQADAAAIRQTHLLTVASSQCSNTGSAAAIVQVLPGDIITSNSQQVNQASTGVIAQTHLVDIANSQQVNQAVSSAISSGSFSGSLSDDDIGRIVVAVLAALNATTIPVDVQKMNGAEVIGDGTELEPWRGLGVPV